MCYLALAIAYPEDCIIVIRLLLGLMMDQVQSASVYGVKGVELSAATIKDDSQLLRNVRDGEYSMVLVSAEFTRTEAWKTLLKEDRGCHGMSFARSLRRIIIDEAHLVREWYGHTSSSNIQTKESKVTTGLSFAHTIGMWVC
jgi:superfamily II DNA helicase RecQ